MPVTVKLSRRFYEVLGDDLANELAEWFNVVDAAYRNEFRDLFEVHFSRFDAKLEQRLAEVKADLRQEIAQRFGALEGRLTGFQEKSVGFRAEMGERLAGLHAEMGGRFAALHAEMDGRFGALQAEMGGRFEALQGELGGRFAAFKAEIEALEDKVVGRVAKWLVISWIGAVGAIVGTMIALQG